MLKSAYLFKEQFDELLRNELINNPDRLKNIYSLDGYNSFTHIIKDDDWDYLQMVSLFDNKVSGFISASLDRGKLLVDQLTAISFTNDKILFTMDLLKFVENLFMLPEYNWIRKIECTCIVDTPEDKMWTKYILKLGGRVVGIKEQRYLIKGKIYDQKIFEILKSNFNYNEIKKLLNE